MEVLEKDTVALAVIPVVLFVLSVTISFCFYYLLDVICKLF